MYCTKCATLLGPTDLFCSNCGTRIKSPDTSDDVQIISPPRAPSLLSRTSTSASIPLIRTPSTYPSSTSSVTSEVRAQKAISTKRDRANNKDILPTSSFGLDPRGKAPQQRTAEVFTVEKGMAPIKVPGALKRLKLLPYQTIEDWSAWVRNQVHGFKQWDTREDPENFVEDEDVPAYVGIVSSTSQGPAELEYEPGSPLGNLLADIPDDGRTRIALIVPVRNISKEEAETLALPPANKRAKSPTGAAIPKRGGKGNKGGKKGQKVAVKRGAIKKEVKEEEEKVKVEEETDEDIDFPNVNEVMKGKRKYMRSSKYPEHEYDTN
jgi:hypothetical protein